MSDIVGTDEGWEEVQRRMYQGFSVDGVSVDLPDGWKLNYACFFADQPGRPRGWYVMLSHDKHQPVYSDGIHEINSTKGAATLDLAVQNAVAKIKENNQ